MSESTKERIVAAGAELIHRQGYNNTGIQEILTACGVPKGSFYHYFPSKEDFGVAVVEHHVGLMSARVSAVLLEEGRPPRERLENFFRRSEERYASQNFTLGCPMGNLALELSDLNPRLRERLEQALSGLAGLIGRVLREAAEQGDLPDGLDPDEAAAFIVEAWEGALLRMKVSKSGEPRPAAAAWSWSGFWPNRVVCLRE